MSGLASDELNTIGFMTAIGVNGALTAASDWTWNGDEAASYGTSGSAHEWVGGANVVFYRHGSITAQAHDR